MSLEVGQSVICADGVALGRVIEVEADAAGTVTGIVIQRAPPSASNVRLPSAWVSGVVGEVVYLAVAHAEVSLRGGAVILFDAERVAALKREQATPRRIHPNWLPRGGLPPRAPEED